MSISSDHPPLPTSGEPTLRDLDTRISHLDIKINTLRRDLDVKVHGLDGRLIGLRNVLRDRDVQQRDFEAEVRGELTVLHNILDDRGLQQREFEAEVRGELTGLHSKFTGLSDRLDRVLNILERMNP
ncbi:hypothetical protein L873DRAFT_1795951 [Choiromyces venosus 120613-1]|uniref:Uncharacterized protein n=1 Tax=Choiromyces venosus 120613-1 TaxID=1336337 RepID=A0A3N4IV36_9PEZI|nr:hypothetical protein L873DRAFT_1795951 [Choiromyces venosus 120613-1]